MYSFRAHCKECGKNITLCSRSRLKINQKVGLSHLDLLEYLKDDSNKPKIECKGEMELTVVRVHGVVDIAQAPVIEECISKEEDT